MKSCPACHRIYEDAISFCLDDGTALASGPESTYDPGATMKIPAARLTGDAPTQVVSEAQPPPTQASPLAGRPSFPQASPLGEQNYTSAPDMRRDGRKSSAAPWILGAALVLGLSAIAVAVIMTRGTDNSQNGQSNQTTNTAPDENAISTPGSNGASSDKMSDPGIVSDAPRVIEAPVRSPTGVLREAPIRADGPSQGPLSDTPPPPAPTPRPLPTGPISGGVLNGKAISKPAPAYPAIAKAARASGTVAVQVTVDESGNVISASAVSGHPLLKQAAVQAARQARFTPTRLSGQPVKVTGIITYNFVLQ